MLGVRTAFEVLHAHFKTARELGSYLRFDRWRLSRYRPNVRAFLEWSRGYAGSLTGPDPAALRRDLERVLPVFLRRRGDA